VKKIICVIALLCLQFSAVISQNTPWQSINPLPQGQPLNGLWTVSPDTLVAIGNNGTIIRSSNAGVTWNVQRTVNSDTDFFNAVQFVSKSVGWVVGDNGVVLKTTDGGFSWVDQGFPLYNTLLGLKFISATIGWVCGSEGLIYKTTDGGSSWVGESTNTKLPLFGLDFVNSQIGFAVGTKGLLLKTTDGGTTWTQKVIDSTKSLYACCFTSSQTGWAVGLSGSVYKTTNGGTSWAKQTSPILTSFFSVHFIDSLNGLAGGSIGSILSTSNGGTTWKSVLPDLNDDIYGIRFASSTIAWAVGDVGRILKSTDAGQTWQLKSSGVKADLYSSFYSSANVGYSVGDTGVIVKTTDGGLSWTPKTSPIYQPFYGVYFISDLIGWVAGDSGVIMKTTDGGNNWVPKNTNVENTLYSIYFVNSSDGWAVGSEGTILKTGNGGSSWSKATGTSVPSVVLEITKVRFFNSSVGLITLSDGSVWKSTNGGSAWTPKSTGVEDYLYSIAWPSSNIVYVTGDYGIILKSTDAGDTWNDMSLLTSSSYYDVAFFNDQIGWAAADEGEIVVTTNGGEDWYSEVNPALTSFFSLQIVRTGAGGLIIASGLSDNIVSSSIYALTRKEWIGASDSLWTNPLNWNPNGVPGRLDSVIIYPATYQPVINSTVQQLDIGTLTIANGARLKINTGLAQLTSSGSITINGTLGAQPSGGTEIITGGDLIMNPGSGGDQGNSVFVCTGEGSIKGTFNNLLVNSGANMYSVGNITILNSIRIASVINMGSTDTLIVRNSAPQAFNGQGLATPGTVKRLIQPGAVAAYRFESPATQVKYHGQGTYPDSIMITTYLNSKPELLPDSLFSPISFSITTQGGTNPPAMLSLRYDESSFLDYNVALFRDSSGITINMGSDEFAEGDYPGISLDTTYLYSRWYVGAGGYIPRLPYQFRNRLIVTDNGHTGDTLRWGSQPGATTGIDAVFGEATLGSKPPSGTFDIRWNLSGGIASKTNYLPMITSGSPINTYTCEFQPGPGGYPVTIRWDSTEFPWGNVLLVDAGTGGTKVKVYMKAQRSVIIYDPTVTSIQIIHRIPAFYSYNKSWNIVSMAQVSTVNPTKGYNFPLAVSSAFGFENGYYVADTLKNGPGYWIKFKDAITVPIEGDPLTTVTIPLNAGWNIIGSIAQSVAVTSIVQSPPDVLTSPVRVYGYKLGYAVTDSIRSGLGYWIKADKAGTITLNGTLAKQSASSSEAEALSQLNSVLISDGSGDEQKLYFGRMDEKGTLSSGSFELPPPPPVGILDACFPDRQMVKMIDYSITGAVEIPVFIRSQHYPVSVSVDFKESQVTSITVVNSANNAVIGQLSADHNTPVCIFDKSVSNITLKVTNGSVNLPKQFALMQNFPNPFNPTTTIRFDLPVQSTVTLELYNILGQRVEFLLNQEQLAAGTHDVRLDASSFASGVYFYRIKAQGNTGVFSAFHEVKKLLLIK
jgi:photosystem II stability/assembly factor-like uncharacterized protein